jgi:hypothetical protein
LSLLNKPNKAPNGQIREQNLRKSSNSTSSSTGTATIAQVVSPSVNSLITSRIVAKLKPMGHTRQNTGNPEIAAARSEPPKMICLESKEARLLAQLTLSAQVLQLMTGVAVSLSLLTICVLLPQSSSFPVQTSSFLAILPSADFLLLNRPLIFCNSGTGQAQAQNALPTNNMSTMTTASEIKALGTSIFAASIVLSAPSGQRMKISIKPKADKVPIPQSVQNPIVTTQSTNSTDSVLKVADFNEGLHRIDILAGYLYPKAL